MLHQKSLRSMLSSSWKYVLIIVACIGLIYFQAIHFEFVTYDDYELVYQNSEFLSQITNALTSFTTHAFTTHRSESAYYRPILLMSFIADYKIWQLNPLGYHLTNLLLHCLTAIGVLMLAEKILRDKLLALLASLLFALHPIQTESVAWVSGRNDVLLGLFVVAMVVSYIHYNEEPKNRKRYLFLTWLSYLLAIFTKESGVFYILLLPLYDLCMRRISLRTFLSRDYALNLVVPIIFFVFYLLLRWNAIGEMIGADKLYGQVPISERIIQIPGLFTKYLSLLLLPRHLSVVHPADQLIWVNFPFNMLAFSITLFIIGGIVISWRKNPLVCFSLLWLGVGLLPALNIFPLAVQILEHRLYVPSVGFVLIITFGVNNLLTKIHWMNGYRYALVA
ncbi:MAG TPA: hypothetical protein VFF29_08060, partial [Bacteroidota bacterium]|nr:hypothetical protein [Bacteroidota bacterium]